LSELGRTLISDPTEVDMRRMLGSVVAGLMGVSAAASAPVLTDGFEQPVVPRSSLGLAAGRAFGAWTVTKGNVDLVTTDLWTPVEGRQSLDLDGNVPGAVARTFRSTPLLTYRISYALAGNYVAAPTVKTGEVRVNGKLVQRMSFDTTGKSRNNMGFTRHTAFVLAKGVSMRLEFASTTTPGGHGPVIDDVRVDSCLVILCPKAAATPV
jgi:choice-of-anchor C domain-containing protein